MRASTPMMDGRQIMQRFLPRWILLQAPFTRSFGQNYGPGGGEKASRTWTVCPEPWKRIFMSLQFFFKVLIENESRSRAQMSRKVHLTVFCEDTPVEISWGRCHQSPDRSKHTQTALPSVTHMTFALSGTEELGQTLHSRNQHNVSEALKRICKNTLIWFYWCVLINGLNSGGLLGNLHHRKSRVWIRNAAIFDKPTRVSGSRAAKPP